MKGWPRRLIHVARHVNSIEHFLADFTGAWP